MENGIRYFVQARVHLFHLRQIFSSPFNCNRIEVRRIVARDQFRDGLKTAGYIWPRKRAAEEEYSNHGGGNSSFTDGTVRVALPPFHPPLNSSITNPCRFSLPRQLLRAFTPITLDGFPPLLPVFVYGSSMEQCTGNTIEVAKRSIVRFFTTIENNANEIVGGRALDFDSYRGWKDGRFQFLNLLRNYCIVSKERFERWIFEQKLHCSCTI